MAIIISLFILISPAGTAVAGWGAGGGNLPALVTGTPAGELNPAERESLAFMIEEEKLARDVYGVLYRKWGLRIFGNIGGSEQQHMEAVRAVLVKYDMPDPTAGQAPGVFADDQLQALYKELIQEGSKSLAAAFRVGATIEDLDIRDLESALAKSDNKDVRLVFQNLMKGSRNHMRSFYRQIKREGQTYEAQYITPELLQQILSTPHERGVVDENGRLI
jgi:hypothetical protein